MQFFNNIYKAFIYSYVTVLILKIFAEVHLPERGYTDEDVQTKDGYKKRKRAHEDDVRNNLSSNSNILSYFLPVWPIAY